MDTLYLLLAVIFFRTTIYAGLEHALKKEKKLAWQSLCLSSALFSGLLISILRSEMVEHNWPNLFVAYGGVIYFGFKLVSNIK